MLGTAGVLGAVIASWPILVALDLMGVWATPAALRQAYPIVLIGAGLVVLFLTLRAVVGWMLEPPGDVSMDGDLGSTSEGLEP